MDPIPDHIQENLDLLFVGYMWFYKKPVTYEKHKPLIYRKAFFSF
jgi:hypothetical protein